MTDSAVGTKSLAQYPVEELKLIFRVLHAGLTDNVELMDSSLLDDLQALLHQKATAEGVDPTDHAALDRWLGNVAISCSDRVAKRRILPFTPGTEGR